MGGSNICESDESLGDYSELRRVFVEPSGRRMSNFD